MTRAKYPSLFAFELRFPGSSASGRPQDSAELIQFRLSPLATECMPTLEPDHLLVVVSQRESRPRWRADPVRSQTRLVWELSHEDSRLQALQRSWCGICYRSPSETRCIQRHQQLWLDRILYERLRGSLINPKGFQFVVGLFDVLRQFDIRFDFDKCFGCGGR